MYFFLGDGWLTGVRNFVGKGVLTCVQHFLRLGFKCVLKTIFNSWDSPLSFSFIIFILLVFYCCFFGAGGGRFLKVCYCFSVLKIVFFISCVECLKGGNASCWKCFFFILCIWFSPVFFPGHRALQDSLYFSAFVVIDWLICQLLFWCLGMFIQLILYSVGISHYLFFGDLFQVRGWKYLQNNVIITCFLLKKRKHPHKGKYS